MSKVRSHTRTVNGQRIHVTEHSRIGEAMKKVRGKKTRHKAKKGPKGTSLARRAWANTKKAFKAGKKKAKWAALGFGVLALVEITAFLSMNLIGFALLSIALIAGATATALVAAANAGGK
ncbi:hypothetical protein ACFWO6_30640 [Paenibacillus glucanolyticus]|uniref:hypothetical protein n=1 Tax=Paenibacillus glucanolyticus TaxID=59843 RepID=UPI00365583DE